MLTQQRHEIILKLLKEKGSITVTEVRDLLDTSESYGTPRYHSARQGGQAGKGIRRRRGSRPEGDGRRVHRCAKNELNCDANRKIEVLPASLIEPDISFFSTREATTAHMIVHPGNLRRFRDKRRFATHSGGLTGFRVILVGGELQKLHRSRRWKPGNPHDPGVSFHQRLFRNKWRNPKKRHNPGRQRGRHQKDRHGTVPPVLHPLRRKQI